MKSIRVRIEDTGINFVFQSSGVGKTTVFASEGCTSGIRVRGRLERVVKAFCEQIPNHKTTTEEVDYPEIDYPDLIYKDN